MSAAFARLLRITSLKIGLSTLNFSGDAPSKPERFVRRPQIIRINADFSEYGLSEATPTSLNTVQCFRGAWSFNHNALIRAHPFTIPEHVVFLRACLCGELGKLQLVAAREARASLLDSGVAKGDRVSPPTIRRIALSKQKTVTDDNSTQWASMPFCRERGSPPWSFVLEQ